MNIKVKEFPRDTNNMAKYDDDDDAPEYLCTLIMGLSSLTFLGASILLMECENCLSLH